MYTQRDQAHTSSDLFLLKQIPIKPPKLLKQWSNKCDITSSTSGVGLHGPFATVVDHFREVKKLFCGNTGKVRT